METYLINVTETLSRVVEQKAESLEDAKAEVLTRYKNCDIMLEYEGDLEGFTFTEFIPPDE